MKELVKRIRDCEQFNMDARDKIQMRTNMYGKKEKANEDK